MSDSRLEKFIYAICSMDVSDLPVPLSRIEKLWNCLITGETPDFEPLSRNEKYLMAMLDRYDISNLPAPMSRGEKLLYKIAVGETDLSDVPGYLSRYEELLKYLIENGGISGGDFEYVLYTFNQSLYTLYTTAEKPVKSAILKGQTLVNLLKTEKNSDYVLNTNYWVVEDDYFKLVAPSVDTSYQWCTIQHRNGSMLQPNSKYLLVFDVKENSCNGTCNLGFDGYESALSHAGQIVSFNDGEIGIKKAIVTTSTTIDVTKGLFRAPINLPNGGKLTFRVMAIPYQEGMENWDIPYFEGMQSVKMPVLTTTGKNLLNVNNMTLGSYISGDGGYGNKVSLAKDSVRACIIIPVKPNTKYRYKSSNIYGYLRCMKSSTIEAGSISGNSLINTIATTEETNYLAINLRHTDETIQQLTQEMINNAEIMLVEGEDVSPYEPFKSNILTVNEEVELRGIGDVQDTLDLMTGELTQRIGEIVLDGSENWANNENIMITKTNTIGFYRGNDGKHALGAIISDNLREITDSEMYSGDVEGINSFQGNIRIRIAKNKLLTQDVAGFKQYLSQNPITVQYHLKTESIKTVDLTVVDQDNQPTQLGTFENITHVSLEAENLIPEVEMEVATHISEELASASPLMDDISTKQEQLSTMVDEQSNNVDATMIATTEIYEETL